MIRINQIKIGISEDISILHNKIKKLLKLNNDNFTYTIVKQSIDSRKANDIFYVYSVNVKLTSGNESSIVKKTRDNNISIITESEYSFPNTNFNKNSKIIIAGSGPAGLFCGLFLARAGYKPVIFERGEDINNRTRIVNAFWENGELNTNTNVQFGEGGAGTFSDGKLNSAVKEKFGRIHMVLETFVEFGAPQNILYVNKPHVGTDILKTVVYNIREEIIRLGGAVYFNSQITDIDIVNGQVKGVVVNSERSYDCACLVIAIGHSARDTFDMLYKKDIAMEQKPFAVGLRLEHPQKLIDEYAYKTPDRGTLPTAAYKVTAKAANGHGVYSFCMCPGGYVVNASSENEHLCVNGMSYSKRDSSNANSAIVVTVDPSDFGGTSVLYGVSFQRKLESAAYNLCNGAVPIQLNEDFVAGKASNGIGNVTPNIKGAYAYGNIREILPEFIGESIIDGMKSFDKMIKGFNMPDCVFSGIESRTSSPVKILRGDNMQSNNVKGLYPCGEGAGYAGGITSAAVDGIKVAEAIAQLT